MPNPKRKMDTSYLSADTTDERGIIHRDLIAHALRWSHVAKELGKQKRNSVAALLDVGCGKELPLAKTLYANRLTHVRYLGLDYGPIQPKMDFNGKWVPAYKERTDAIQFLENVIQGVTYDDPLPADVDQDTGSLLDALGQLPNYVVSFEVFEHMMPDHLARLLLALRRVVVPGAKLWFSTPVYDSKVGAALNHINEMTIATLGTMLEGAGFEVTHRWGTFASQKDYREILDHVQCEEDSDGNLLRCDAGFMAALFDQLAKYYDSNLVSVLWAPLFPNHSRNNLWECTPHQPKADEGSSWKRFNSTLVDVPELRGQCLDEDAWANVVKLLNLSE